MVIKNPEIAMLTAVIVAILSSKNSVAMNMTVYGLEKNTVCVYVGNYRTGLNTDSLLLHADAVSVKLYS